MRCERARRARGASWSFICGPGKMSVLESHALCDRIEAALMAHLAKAQITIHVEPGETQAPHG